MSQYIVLILMAISATVVILLAKKKNAWPVIVLYWVVLTVKNLVDYLSISGVVK